jgi:hypothetical protein
VKRPRQLGAGAVLLASAIGAGLIGAAMYLYPGGSSIDRHRVGHSFWFNFLCDLTGETAINGASNRPGSSLARAGMGSFAVALGAFWMILPSLFRRGRRRAAVVVRVAGGISALGLLAVPVTDGPTHAIAVFCSSIPGLVAGAVGFACTLRDVRDRPLLVIACATLVVAAADSVLYARAVITHPKVTTPALPALQRVAFLLIVSWMNLVAVRVLSRAQPPGPSVMM